MIWCDCWDVRYGFIFPLTINAVSSIFNTLSCDSKKNMVCDASMVDMLVDEEMLGDPGAW